MPTWEDVVEISMRFPRVEEKTSYGTPALKVKSRGGICRMRTDPDALVLRVIDMEEREALLQGDPATFFTIPHYDGYPYVLAHLDRIDRQELGELLEEAWRVRASKRSIAEFEAR